MSSFNALASFYNDIMDECEYSEKLTFEKEQYTHERKNREKCHLVQPSV